MQMRQPGMTLLDRFDFEYICIAGDSPGHTAGDDQVIAAVESEDFCCLLLGSVEEDFGGVVGVAECRSDAPGEGKFPVGFFIGSKA